MKDNYSEANKGRDLIDNPRVLSSNKGLRNVKKIQHSESKRNEFLFDTNFTIDVKRQNSSSSVSGFSTGGSGGFVTGGLNSNTVVARASTLAARPSAMGHSDKKSKNKKKSRSRTRTSTLSDVKETNIEKRERLKSLGKSGKKLMAEAYSS